MRRAQGGFTLIELMVVVAIIGVLASVALPTYQRVTLRAKRAERALMMKAIRSTIDDYFTQRDQYPWGDPTFFSYVIADYNPPMPVNASKRHFNPRMAGWNELALVVQGDCYYSYWLLAEAESTFNLQYLQAFGDLDGDGIQSQKYEEWLRQPGGINQLIWEYPDPATDDRTF